MQLKLRQPLLPLGTRSQSDDTSSTGRAPLGGWLEQPDPAEGHSFAPLAALIVACAAGLAIVAVAYAGARQGQSWADAAFWTGLVVIVAPVAARLVGPEATRAERLILVMILGLALYGVVVLLSPNQFSLHDELGQYRTVADILRTGHLYTKNAVVAAYSSYPGLGAVTAALSRLSGLGIVASGLFVIGVAKLLLVGGLFLALERVTHSARAAGIAVLVYVANPNFFFFDSQFAYESLAIGIGAVALWMLTRAADPVEGNWRDVLVAAALDGALVLTHHLTSYALLVIIVAWALIVGIRGLSAPPAKRLIALALFALVITGAYAVFTFRATQSDIGSSITGSFRALAQVVTGVSNGRAPFTAAGGYSDPLLEQLVGLASVALLVVAWPFGLLAAWRGRAGRPGVVILGVAALLYPASLALRLTAAGNETSNRTSEFIFVGLGAALALAFLFYLAGRIDRHGWPLRALAAAYIGLVFIGGITVGTPSYDLLPANFQVAADTRSIDTEGVAAAHWAAHWLTPSGYFFSDETDNELWSAYTRLAPQSGKVHGTPIGSLFVSFTFTPQDRRIIQVDKLRLLVVDNRDSGALPRAGHYFEGADPESYASPIATEALTKFDSTPCINRIFSSGNIVVYDTQPILRGCS